MSSIVGFLDVVRLGFIYGHREIVGESYCEWEWNGGEFWVVEGDGDVEMYGLVGLDGYVEWLVEWLVLVYWEWNFK